VPALIALAHDTMKSWNGDALYTAYLAALACDAAIIFFMLPQNRSFIFKRLRRSFATRDLFQPTPNSRQGRARHDWRSDTTRLPARRPAGRSYDHDRAWPGALWRCRIRDLGRHDPQLARDVPGLWRGQPARPVLLSGQASG